MAFKYNINGTVGLGNILDSILKNRGIENIPLFLNPTESCLEDILLFDNIVKARDCLNKHISNNSKIAIIVDTDCDGFTSASLIYQYIKRIQPELQIDYILHEGKEHGVDDKSYEIVTERKYNLLIVPDAGTNDVTNVTHLCNDFNIDVIILDHHLCSRGEPYYDDYPAIIVNNQMSKKITDKAMTGVGVTYKFIQLLDQFYNVKYADDYLDLVAVGMIADSCDLRNLQSRYLVLKGIQQISDNVNKNRFISQLIKAQSYSMNNVVTIIGVAFYISPLINSLIRIGSQEDKENMFKAFTNSDETIVTKVRGKGEMELSIQEYATKLCESSKRKQKKIVDDSVIQMKEQIESYGLDKNAILVCNARDNVDKNYTGLIANKLASIYQRPCLLLRDNNGYCSGSGRGYDKSEIKDFNGWCQSTGLFKFAEGHNQAFGCGLSSLNINKLYETISKMNYSNELVYDVDARLDDKTLNKTIIEMVAKYNNIWGNGIDEPVFAIENIIINKSGINLIGKNQTTLKFTHHNIDFVKFNSNTEEYDDIISLGDSVKFTVIGRFSINEYGGTKTAQILVDDMMFEKSNEIKKFRF